MTNKRYLHISPNFVYKEITRYRIMDKTTGHSYAIAFMEKVFLMPDAKRYYGAYGVHLFAIREAFQRWNFRIQLWLLRNGMTGELTGWVLDSELLAGKDKKTIFLGNEEVVKGYMVYPCTKMKLTFV